MKKVETSLPGVFIIEPEIHGDRRGWFMETYSKRAFTELGIEAVFVQDNESFTAQKGTLRGLHFQKDPMAQAKLVRVLQGAVLDVAVDLRRGSPCYLRWTAAELSESNRRMLFIPRGFAHGFLTLTDNVVFSYKVDNFYAPDCDRSIRFDDPEIGVDWGVLNPILSEKDRTASVLRNSDCNFVYED